MIDSRTLQGGQPKPLTLSSFKVHGRINVTIFSTLLLKIHTGLSAYNFKWHLVKLHAYPHVSRQIGFIQTVNNTFFFYSHVRPFFVKKKLYPLFDVTGNIIANNTNYFSFNVTLRIHVKYYIIILIISHDFIPLFNVII